ncbi:piriformospora indica-insensitive protein 2-like [Prosopis cineraria]|uniref:piriformospora indica-insensitive protein 2-like n=1 Tax=Prosopis cineraria TaxID=364024 RepID=UPI0024107313|nr:piriformospora indica-insensitive protein 2-like [Prosopis cineraria]
MSFKTVVIGHAILAVFIILLVGSRCFGQVEEADVSMAPMEKKELEALYSTIQGFVGNWWNGSDLYPDPCGWTPIQGVSCDLINGFWYVTTLNIGPVYDNSLTCVPNLEFRSNLFELRHLKVLYFFNCFQSQDKYPFSIPKGNWEKLSDSLESLEFRSNPGLVGSIPSSLGVLKNLQSLILLENGLAGEIPPHIGNLIKLKRLVLAENSLSGHIPDVLNGFTELLILDLSGNSLSGPLPLSVGSLTSLLKLDLSNNHLEGNLVKEIGHLKNLTLMDLKNNKFSGGLSQSFQEMFSLEELVLSNNPIGGSLRILKWENLQNLAVLELSNVGLRGEIPGSLSRLKRLRYLGLGDNNLTGNLSQELASLPCLNALYLNSNNLTGELKFSEEFYGKMGRRFGAWNNPKLCYAIGRMMSTSHVPFGVRPC